MIYQWKKNIPLTYPVEAQRAGEVLENIANRDGSILPGTVVSESRPSEAPLHPCFEWDDSTAAEKYRDGQARSLIKNLVTVNVINGEEKPVTSFVSVNIQSGTKEPKRYVSIETAMQDEEMKRQVMQKALQELNSFRKKYNEIQEFSKLFGEIDSLMSKAI